MPPNEGRYFSNYGIFEWRVEVAGFMVLALHGGAGKFTSALSLLAPPANMCAPAHQVHRLVQMRHDVKAVQHKLNQLYPQILL